MTYCCVPSGCSRYLDEPILLDDPGDAVKMICSNESCPEGEFMHAECFIDWEERILSYLRNSGRARGWSEKQRHQNLWNKKGYDLAFKMCDCKCGRGYLRVDQIYAATRADEEKKQKKNKKKPPAINTISNGSTAQQIQQQLNGRDARSPLRIHRSSCSSGGSWSGSSPSSSAGTTPVTPPGIFMPTGLIGMPNNGCSAWESRKNSLESNSSRSFGGTHFEMVTSEHHAAVGHMFKHRKDLNIFNCLSHQLRNTFQIRMEDEGPHGNDEIRCQILTCLSSAKATSVQCVVCYCEMTVYDKFPVIDGTFFLSPTCYHPTPEELRVNEPAVSSHHRGNGNRSNHFNAATVNRKYYLNAVCMYCMEGGGVSVGKSPQGSPTSPTSVFPPTTATDGRRGLRLSCRSCCSSWSGRSLVIGTMYAYDVFAAAPCCATRLRCNRCRQLLIEPTAPLKYFSDYSRLVRCGACGAEDHHFVKPLDDVFVKNMP